MIAWAAGFFLGNWALWLPALGFLGISILLKDIRLIVCAVVALVAVGYVGNLKGELAHAEDRATKAEDASKEWRASVDKQDEAIAGWKAAAVKNASLMRAAEKRALDLATKIPTNTAATLSENIPAKAAEPTCEESIQWLITPERLSHYLW